MKGFPFQIKATALKYYQLFLSDIFFIHLKVPVKISRAYNFCLSIISYFKLKVTSILHISTKVFFLQFNYIHFQDTTYEIKNVQMFLVYLILIELSLFNDVNVHFASLLTILHQIMWKQKP